MPLSDVAVRKAKAADKDDKLRDGGNLHLLVKKNGSKYWRFDYRYLNKRKTLALGVYPDVPLKKARELHQQARELLADNIDPNVHKKTLKHASQEQASNSFENIAREWHKVQSPKWSQSHAQTILRRLERNIFPWLGNEPITQITPPEVLNLLRQIEARGANETAHRVLQICGQICRYAVGSGRAESDPCRDLHGILTPVQTKHYAAITDPAKIPALMRAIQGYEGSFITQCALHTPLGFYPFG